MAGKSSWLENRILDYVLRGVTYTKPTTIYIALYTTAPTDTGGGVEPSGGSYARVAITCGMTAFSGTQGAGTTTASTGTGGTVSNNIAITFPAPTDNWGTVTHFGIYDDGTPDHILYWGPLNAPKVINSGDGAPSFAPGTLVITED